MIIRRLAALAGAVTVAALLPALPAEAHGAPTTPISRTAACAGGGSKTSSAACKAAKTANGGALGSFDNLRIPNVNGNDRKAVPDGELCSGGLDAYKGLNVARDDFPSTAVAGGQTLKIKYKATIPHAGKFRVFITDAGYDVTKKLTWDDLGSKPLVQVTDPPLVDGAYSMSAKLPQRTGRQILYIVWETTSTPDTYYSCSDLAFKAADKPKPPVATTKPAVRTKAKPAVTSAAPTGDEAPSASAAAPAPEETTPQALTPVGDESNVTLGHEIIAGAVILAAAAAGWGVIGAVRRRRRENR